MGAVNNETNITDTGLHAKLSAIKQYVLHNGTMLKTQDIGDYVLESNQSEKAVIWGSDSQPACYSTLG